MILIMKPIAPSSPTPMNTIFRLREYVFQSGLVSVLRRRDAFWKKLPSPMGFAPMGGERA
jgi:hypothetical protein